MNLVKFKLAETRKWILVNPDFARSIEIDFVTKTATIALGEGLVTLDFAWALAYLNTPRTYGSNGADKGFDLKD